MKIIIPVDEASVESGVCVSFGRAPYFMLCEGGKAEFLPNPGAEAEGGAGLKAAKAVADSGAEALVTVRCGENAAQVLKAAGMAICKINIDTDIRLAMTASIRKQLVEHPEEFDPRGYLKPARQAVKDMVQHKIKHVLGCSGKA